MPKGPKGQKGPADVIGNAVTVAKIATGEAEEEYDGAPQKDPNAVALGRRGGKKGGDARAKRLSPEDRKEIAKKAAAVRWGDKNGYDKGK